MSKITPVVESKVEPPPRVSAEVGTMPSENADAFYAKNITPLLHAMFFVNIAAAVHAWAVQRTAQVHFEDKGEDRVEWYSVFVFRSGSILNFDSGSVVNVSIAVAMIAAAYCLFFRRYGFEQRNRALHTLTVLVSVGFRLVRIGDAITNPSPLAYGRRLTVVLSDAQISLVGFTFCSGWTLGAIGGSQSVCRLAASMLVIFLNLPAGMYIYYAGGEPGYLLAAVTYIVLPTASGFAVELGQRWLIKFMYNQLHAGKQGPGAGVSEEELQQSPDPLGMLGLIGRGSAGEVFLVRCNYGKSKDRLFAMKRVAKLNFASGQLARLDNERRILEQLSHPFIVELAFSFESPHSVYFVMSYAAGRDLSYWVRDSIISEECGRVVAAEILLALEYLHSKFIVYRDLKPENTLVGLDGHVLLADFGISKLLRPSAVDGVARKHTNARTLVGTPDYMAPEVVAGGGYTHGVDYWALAVLLHEMLSDTLPHFQLSAVASQPAGSWPWERDALIAPELPAVTRDLLSRMLKLDPSKRLGGGDPAAAAAEIQGHPFFAPIQWDELLRKKVAGPLTVQKLSVGGQRCLHTFDTAMVGFPTSRGSKHFENWG